ncbi:MAG: class II fructose-bisphosphate aldolase [Opitutaceae bacterium]|jgi:fructose-bisphosphate aldolase class II|nr:class II fructose-bisphosphate aldolase [Opitutaceae bacterium]
MRLLARRSDVIARLRQAGEQHAPLLCPNAETPDEMEGILLGAQRHARSIGAREVTIGIGFTAGYPDHPQLGGLALPGRSLADTASLWLYWLNGYAGRPGLFDEVEVIPFLDHGWVPHAPDRELMDARWFQDAAGILMFDASAHDLDENIRLTAAFVARAGDRVVVEACPDKVYEHAERERKQLREADLLSRPEAVDTFVRRTGADLVVPNLGTEHRATGAVPLDYRRDLAREITRRVGPVQALHGTSSLGGRLGTVGADGICKINYYTGMARAAATAVRTALDAAATPDPLPVSHTCGSFSHRTRREAVAANIAGVLATLRA